MVAELFKNIFKTAKDKKVRTWY